MNDKFDGRDGRRGPGPTALRPSLTVAATRVKTLMRKSRGNEECVKGSGRDHYRPPRTSSASSRGDGVRHGAWTVVGSRRTGSAAGGAARTTGAGGGLGGATGAGGGCCRG